MHFNLSYPIFPYLPPQGPQAHFDVSDAMTTSSTCYKDGSLEEVGEKGFISESCRAPVMTLHGPIGLMDTAAAEYASSLIHQKLNGTNRKSKQSIKSGRE